MNPRPAGFSRRRARALSGSAFRHVPLIVLSGVSFGLAAAGAEATEAKAVYPKACCPNYCAPVTKVRASVAKDGTRRLEVTSQHGKATVPPDVSIRESFDGQMHVCMYYDAFGDLKITCILKPPNS
jgi:hypothetical protein